jgi:hypothetical protein
MLIGQVTTARHFSSGYPAVTVRLSTETDVRPWAMIRV